MTCIHPPELTDDQISDLLDGRALTDVREHLEQCPYCRARFKQARQLEQTLRYRLHRLDCPTSDTLRDYAFNMLGTSVQKQVAIHLDTCPRCREELRQLNNFLGEDVEKTPAQLTRAPRRILPNIWRPQPIHGLPVVAMRGRDSSETIMLETNGITIFLEVQSDGDRLWLAGRLLAPDMNQWEGALVEVWRDDSLQTAASVQNGGFRCRLHTTGTVAVRISPKSGTSLLIEKLKFVDEPPE